MTGVYNIFIQIAQYLSTLAQSFNTYLSLTMRQCLISWGLPSVVLNRLPNNTILDMNICVAVLALFGVGIGVLIIFRLIMTLVG